MARSGSRRRVGRLPLSGAWSLAPAAVTLTLLVGAGLGYATVQSLGALSLTGDANVGFDAYRSLLTGSAGTVDLWSSAAFTLWVSAMSTALAAVLALVFIVWLEAARSRRQRLATGLLHVNLAIPHVVWALALLLLLSQSGILARIAGAAGWFDVPADAPTLVRDTYGVGLIIHFASKEMPFLALIGLALLRSQPPELARVADTLGARGFRRARLFVLPTVLPGVAAGAALVFAFVFGAYEAPIVLGTTSPRTLSVVGLDLFAAPDLRQRPVAMALGVLMALSVVLLGFITWALGRRRRR